MKSLLPTAPVPSGEPAPRRELSPSDHLRRWHAVLRRRRHAALNGAMAVGLPAMAVASLLSLVLLSLASAVDALLPADPLVATVILVFTVCFAGPAALALPLGLLGGSLARLEAEESKDLGRAAAAGVGMAASMVALGWVILRAGSLSEFLITAPLLLGVATFTGLVGASSFRAAEVRPARLPSELRQPLVPPLYQGFLAAGAAGVGHFVLSAALLFLAPMLGWIYPAGWAATAPAALGEFGWYAVTMGALAPVTYLVARHLPRWFRRGSLGAVAGGVLFAAAVPVLSKLGFALSISGGALNPYLAAAGGYALGLLPHLGATWTGVRAAACDRARRRLLSSPAAPLLLR